ncbi:MAG: arylamine N-acetyltransferase, partial [Caldilinea sp.]|nr:arylamine N-acetyltransferase [Caldilinea sp.]
MTELAHGETRALVEAYLARIGVDRAGSPTAATLARLQQAHMLHVPFESLSIGWGEQIELELSVGDAVGRTGQDARGDDPQRVALQVIRLHHVVENAGGVRVLCRDVAGGEE